MKINILLGAFYPVPTLLGGAVEKMWLMLAIEFARLGHEVNMVSRLYGDLPKAEKVAGVNHIRIKGYSMPRSGLKIKLLDLFYTLRAGKVIPEADLTVTNTFWAPLLLPKRAGNIYVDVARMPKGQMRFYGKASRLRANSTPVLTAIRKELHDTEHNRAQLIPNPLPFHTQNDPDSTEKEKRILYVGRVHPEKGIDILLDAWHLLPGSLKKEWTLDIVGPWDSETGGGGEGYHQQLLNRYPESQVNWVGPVFDTERLHPYYRRATLFVYPSIAEKGETFGLAPLEAMAWGCVPIVSSLECFQDFIIDGINGKSFDHRSSKPSQNLADCIQQLAGGDIDSMREKALEVRETHSATKIAEAFLSDFGEIISGQP